MTQVINSYTDVPKGKYASEKEYYENNKDTCYRAVLAWKQRNSDRVNEYAREHRTYLHCELCDSWQYQTNIKRHQATNKQQDKYNALLEKLRSEKESTVEYNHA
jgi:hypothetical protein